jgi:glutaminase
MSVNAQIVKNANPLENTFSELLQQWVDDFRIYSKQGNCAAYIPALANADPDRLGICIMGEDGKRLMAGEWNMSFTMQSISKVVSFVAACLACGIEEVLGKVDVEPTGDAFNSIVRLESHKPGKPFNPMINAGAITVASLLPGSSAGERLESILLLLEKLLDKRPEINEDVFKSECETASLNRAIAYYLKENRFIASPVEEILEVYFKQCSLEVTTEDLAMISLVIANDGFHPLKQEQIIPEDICKITKALMLTCGMYNASGNFAAFVGVPAKSGVSGGIMAAVPSRDRRKSPFFQESCGIGIYSPAIDKSGNSVAGVMLLKQLTSEWGLNIF